MELFIEEVLDDGQWVNTLHASHFVDASQAKYSALIRLQGRAAMTAQEVLILLRSGFSSGNMARWRTLHEVWVIFSVLRDGDDELSRRYLAHDAVESMKGQDDYEGTWATLGYDPPEMTAEQREGLRASLSEEFGRAFLRDYGWAAPLFDDKAPKFNELQKVAELDHWRSHYRMASHPTHANPKGISWSIQAGEFTDVIWAGPSNAGLLDPAQCSLIATTAVTVGLVAYAIDDFIDDDTEMMGALLRQQRIMVLSEAAIDKLSEIHEQLEKAEEYISGLIEPAANLLRTEPGLTIGELTSRLGVDADQLEEAMIAGTMQGVVRPETRYWVSGSTLPSD
jgi:hypothetical protein